MLDIALLLILTHIGKVGLKKSKLMKQLPDVGLYLNFFFGCYWDVSLSISHPII